MAAIFQLYRGGEERIKGESWGTTWICRTADSGDLGRDRSIRSRELTSHRQGRRQKVSLYR